MLSLVMCFQSRCHVHRVLVGMVGHTYHSRSVTRICVPLGLQDYDVKIQV